MGQVRRVILQIVCFPIMIYQWFIRPIIGPCCRFHPSCSNYALEAIRMKGIFVGVYLTIRRILRCHPWSPGGYDPILPNKEKA